ncbi:MAG TPA: peptidylprolyl isomerase [Gemmataceae bacterium]|nr:peptidylprolyl isomerase [Gemmataceae bacterium]
MPHRLRAPLLVAVAALAGCTGRTAGPASAEPVPGPAEIATGPGNKYDQPFDKAITDELGEDQRPPVERTIGGKSSAGVREAVARAWPTIQLADADGKPIAWTVKLDTDAGEIEIALRPDLAPNHVRNFLALTKVGYYDGMRFDRLVHQEAVSPDGQQSIIRLVRFGCPAGTGDPGIGHVGYRLRSEFTDEKHDAGTVGFTREADPNSAGTRLYITLAPAPAMDGNFTVVGKVSKGLDVVERIAAGKLLPSELDETRELPERPVAIRKATTRSGP